jgi:hypothetical protein
MAEPTVRPPVRAGSFYPSSAGECRQELAECRRLAAKAPAELRGAKIFGGIVPHAGWVYSGPTAAAVFEALVHGTEKPETVILFGTAHRPDVREAALQARGSWRVPTGEVAIDEELAAEMLAQAGQAGVLVERAAAHGGDHAIEVQLPFLIEFLPGARFVPVAAAHGKGGPEAGEAAARAVRKLGRRAVALASTDLTHYGPNYYGWAPEGVGAKAHRWSKEVNDRKLIERMLALDAAGTFQAGEEDGSACGPAAAAAAVAFAKAQGAKKGVLIEHITSWERAKHEQGEPTDFVGYAAVAFV